MVQQHSRKVHVLTTSRPEDSEYEVANMQPGIGQLEVFPSIWGRTYKPHPAYV